MNVIQEIRRINERELEQGVSGKASWHHEYKDSAWVFAGGFPYDLTEGDILCVMSQWGEIEDINLCREKDTGKSKGFCFIKYENQKSTILAVDNFNGIDLLGRTIRVDHKHKYSLPAEVREKAEKEDEERIARGEAPSEKGPQWRPGVAYEGKQLATSHNFHKGVDVFAKPEQGSGSSDESDGAGGTLGESAAAKKERREAKRKRKEARADARERKKRDKESSAGGDGSDGYHKKKKSKHHRKDKKKEDKKEGRAHGKDNKTRSSENPRAGNGGRGEEKVGERHDHRRDKEPPTSRSSGADASGAWERGARAPGDGPYSGGPPFSSSSQPSGRAPALAPPVPLSSGNVMDWRGLGGRGAGGRGGGKGGGRGRGAPQSGGRGTEGMNSMGGMDRRR
ncbi:unnamed protein product [Ectocarpus sp. CCAP 1310/34]|nr:unnamed protein product [Ectocarpus sp. CCAP 1310/34]